MITAYTTAAESDVHLAAYADWLALTDAEKDSHLSWGRVWIDSRYTCLNYDETNATEEIKQANSLVAYQNFLGVLFSNSELVKSKSVTAGSVSTSKTYASGYSPNNPALVQADLLLKYDCTSTHGNSTVGLSRN